MTVLPLKKHRVLCIMPTFKCSAACDHCGTFSNMRNSHPWLERGHVLRAINEASDAGYFAVVFTGGEPTLALELVLEGIARARELGLFTRVVTNASWATTDGAARDVVQRLVEAGLNEINFSTGSQHQRFVPLENIVRAVRAALLEQIKNVCVMVEVIGGTTFRAADLTTDPHFIDTLTANPRSVVTVIESPWMPMRHDNIAQYPASMLLNKASLSTRSGCTSCLQTTTVQADGRIGVCCGLGMRTVPELQVGHIASKSIADADVEASNDFLKRWIALEGPEHILAWAAEHDPSILWEDMYAHKCQSCLRIYKDEKVREVISAHHQEKIADVILGEFLLSHFVGAPSPRNVNEHVVA